MNIQTEGTIAFWLLHEHKDWSTNQHGYKFGLVKVKGIEVEVTKHRDKTIEFNIDGPLGHQFNVRVLIPRCDEQGVHVVIAWKHPEVKLYLNGKIAEKIVI